jgi:hypothetical protein
LLSSVLRVQVVCKPTAAVMPRLVDALLHAFRLGLAVVVEPKAFSLVAMQLHRAVAAAALPHGLAAERSGASANGTPARGRRGSGQAAGAQAAGGGEAVMSMDEGDAAAAGAGGGAMERWGSAADLVHTGSGEQAAAAMQYRRALERSSVSFQRNHRDADVGSAEAGSARPTASFPGRAPSNAGSDFARQDAQRQTDPDMDSDVATWARAEDAAHAHWGAAAAIMTQTEIVQELAGAEPSAQLIAERGRVGAKLRLAQARCPRLLRHPACCCTLCESMMLALCVLSSHLSDTICFDSTCFDSTRLWRPARRLIVNTCHGHDSARAGGERDGRRAVRGAADARRGARRRPRRRRPRRCGGPRARGGVDGAGAALLP